MSAIRERIIAGNLIFEKLINRKSVRKNEKRAARHTPTAEEVEMVNRRNSEKTLQIKLHHNFNSGDYHLVLTYSGKEPSQEEAQAELKKFIRKARKAYKKLDIAFKWISVTEYKNKRIHHHLIINKGVEVEEIRRLWGHGFIHDRRLDKSGDWRKLGEYLMKETDKTFRSPHAASRLRYSCSRNLSMPLVYREEIPISELFEEPKPLKGYYIDKESLFNGYNPITGRPYIEYVMLALDERKIRKRFYKMDKYAYKQENYDKLLKKISPYQLEFEIK